MFSDRGEAGRRLAEHLTDFENRDGVVVLGLPREVSPLPTNWLPVSTPHSM
jgi:predicted phosphoribosyltransferase